MLFLTKHAQNTQIDSPLFDGELKSRRVPRATSSGTSLARRNDELTTHNRDVQAGRPNYLKTTHRLRHAPVPTARSSATSCSSGDNVCVPCAQRHRGPHISRHAHAASPSVGPTMAERARSVASTC